MSARVDATIARIRKRAGKFVSGFSASSSKCVFRLDSPLYNNGIGFIATEKIEKSRGSSIINELSDGISYPADEIECTTLKKRTSYNTTKSLRLQIDPNFNSYYSEAPLKMNTNTSTYVRAVNDYSLSAHQYFYDSFNQNPNMSAIIPFSGAEYTNIDNIIESFKKFFDSKNFTCEISGNVTYSPEEDERDEYSVYRQTVVTCFSRSHYDVGMVIDILGTTNIVSVTAFSRNSDIVNQFREFAISERPKFKTFVEERKEKTFYTIASGMNGFRLEDLTIKAVHTNGVIYENYNDDFVEADKVIQDSIDQEKKGLILLHGLPGSGKTSYIKHLITGSSKRKIVYIPTHLTTAISSPEFVSFVKQELTNSVLVIEDAEQVLIAREDVESHKAAVSNILNMTDGILADALNLLIICTFNTDMNNIDKALLRKGRLLIQYQFKELSLEKTKVLADKLYGTKVDKPMVLSDIYNLEYDLIKPDEAPKVTFGFTPSNGR